MKFPRRKNAAARDTHDMLVISERPWAQQISSVPPELTNFVTVVASLLGGVFVSNGQITWGCISIVVVLGTQVLDWLRRDRMSVVNEKRLEIREDAVRSLLLALTDASQGIGDALTMAGKTKREGDLIGARKAILSIVRQKIGPESGVRVNLFVVTDSAEPLLEATTYGHEGRQNHRSTRTFSLRDESLRAAICRNDGRYVANTAEVDSSLAYGCFAVMPVSTDEKLFGLLTVDAHKAGDISEFEATVMLNTFASLMTLTFVKEENNFISIDPGLCVENEVSDRLGSTSEIRNQPGLH